MPVVYQFEIDKYFPQRH